MAAFEYLALDPNGRSKKGVLTGDSSRQIRSQLRLLGLHPMEVRSVKESPAHQGRSFSRQSISAADLALLTRQLATLVRAGIPLEESLRALGEQVESSRLKSVVAGIRAEITEGVSLHKALSKYPGIFSDVYRVMVEAGEAGGKLEEVLDRLADYTEERQALRQKISVALIYPCLVSFVAIVIVIALVTYVVPEVVKVFEQTGQQLPLLTQTLIATSDLLRDYGLFMLVGVAGLLALWRLLLNRNSVRLRWDRLLLRLPLIGRLNRTVNTARLTRTLAILTDSGVPLLDALEVATRTIKNTILRHSLTEAATTVREGGRLHSALRAAPYFPPLLVHMLAAGEESGELENILERAASHQERELETTVSAATSVLEPIIILVMGVVVLVIVLAILLPIFEMNQLVGA